MCVLKFGLDENDNIAILCDPKGFMVNYAYINENKYLVAFQNTLLNLREKPYYDTDYPINNNHVIKIKTPDFVNINKFKEGKFSEIYSKDIVEQLFNKYCTEYKILTKDRSYFDEFINRISRDFKIEGDDLEEIKKTLSKKRDLEFNYIKNKNNEYLCV